MQTGLGPTTRALGDKVFVFLLSLSVWMLRCTCAASNFEDGEIYTTTNVFCKRCDKELGLNQCCVNGISHCQHSCVADNCLQCLEYPDTQGLRKENLCLHHNDVTCQNSTCEPGDNKEHASCICRDHLANLNRCVDDVGDGNEVNVTAIILGWILSLVLLLVIVGAVVLYLQRRGHSSGQPSMVSSDVELAANGSNRAQLPEPPTLGGSVGYSYAYDHLSPNQSAEIHAYDYVDDGEGSSHHNVPRKAPSPEKDGVTEDAQETQGQEVPVKEEDNRVTGEDERTVDAVVEVTDSSSGGRSTEGNDTVYFTLIPTEEQDTPNEASGYEVAAVPHEGGVASSLKEVLTNKKEETNIYFPLLPNNIDHKSPNEQPDRNKVEGVMHPATFNVQGESETPGCSCLSPKTTGAEQTTSPSYDHLVRDSYKASHGGALSGQNKNDNYQQRPHSR